MTSGKLAAVPLQGTLAIQACRAAQYTQTCWQNTACPEQTNTGPGCCGARAVRLPSPLLCNVAPRMCHKILRCDRETKQEASVHAKPNQKGAPVHFTQVWLCCPAYSTAPLSSNTAGCFQLTTAAWQSVLSMPDKSSCPLHPGASWQEAQTRAEQHLSARRCKAPQATHHAQELQKTADACKRCRSRIGQQRTR